MKNFEELGVSPEYLKQLKKWDMRIPCPFRKK
jgi:hypothetical protein